MSLRNTIGRTANLIEVRAPGLTGSAGAKWRGNWSASTITYQVNDLVRYLVDGNLYICVLQHISDATPNIPTLTSIWDVFAALEDAEKWATTALNTVVTDSQGTTGYSAIHQALKSKDWASLVGDAVTADGTVGVTGADVDYSSKAWAVGGAEVTGFATRGSAKDWAVGAGGTMASKPDNAEYGAKEYAQGQTATGGTSKQWALGGGAFVEATEVTSGNYSASRYASLASADSATATTKATEAAASQLAAKNSAAATAAVFDAFDDTYLGSMPDRVFTANASTEFITSATHGLENGDIIRVASQTTLPDGLSASTNYFVINKTTNTCQLSTSSGGSAINITDTGSGTHTWGYGVVAVASVVLTANSSVIPINPTVGILVGMAVSGTGIQTSPVPNVISVITNTSVRISEPVVTGGTETVTFTAAGVIAAMSVAKDGPLLNNDGDALASGLLYFNSSDREMRIYDGSNWIAASAAASTAYTEYQYVASGGQTSFSGSDVNGATMAFTAGNLIVFLNGVQLKLTTDYTLTSTTTVVLGVAAVVSDELNVIAFKSFSVSDTVSASAGGTFTASVILSGSGSDLTVGGDLAVTGITTCTGNLTAPNQATTGKAIAMALVFG